MENNSVKELSTSIRKKALELGFNICGIAKVRILERNENILRKWCKEGMNDGIGYLARDIEKRANPALLLPGAESVVVTGLSYFTGNKQSDPEAPIIARYTYGQDYHVVIKRKLEKLRKFVTELQPGTEGQTFIDSGYILEKAWAQEAGLGWQGKHSVVINREIGSFFFIGILLLNIKLDYDEPFKRDLCGNCTICIDQCPTGAINNNRTLDTRKCIANLTIESKNPLNETIVPKVGRRVYGCDKCQEVCPWNKHPETEAAPDFAISPEIAGMTLEEWQTLSKERFDRLFKNSAISRVKYEKFIKNISLVTKPNQ